MKPLLLQYIDYNLWANKRIAEVMCRIDTKLYDTEVASSFSSLRLTVKHMYDAEMIWLMRLQGIRLTPWPTDVVIDDERIKIYFEISEKFLNFLLSVPDEFFAGKCTHTNLKGREFTQDVSGIIMHVANHSTYHRGQLITMFRSLGITELPSTDFINYLRLKQS